MSHRTASNRQINRHSARRRRRWVGVCSLLTMSLAVGAAQFARTDHAAAALSGDFGSSKNLWIQRDVLLSLPTSGSEWERLAHDATGSWGSANISDQDNDHDVLTLGGALYAVRMNDTAMRDRVVAAIESAIGTEAGGRTLALTRNLTGYVLAADLVGYQSTEFTEWLRSVRFEELDGRTLVSTHEDRPNNWGTHSGAARIAVDRYLGDQIDLARAVTVFRGYVGDRSAYAGFKYGDPEWQADPSAPVPINPAGTTKNGYVVDGAIVDDVRRCGCDVTSPAPKENYQWEAMQGIVTQAELLWAAGYTDVWSWSDAAIRRAVDFLYQQAQFPAAGDDAFLTYLIDAHLGTGYSAGVDGHSGKSIGYTGWTHGHASPAPAPTTTPTTAPAPTATVAPTATTPIVAPATATTVAATTTTVAPATTTPTTIAAPTTTVTPTTVAPAAVLTVQHASLTSGSELVAGEERGSHQDTWTRGDGSHIVIETTGGSRDSDQADLRWTIPALDGAQVLDLVLTVGPASGDLDQGFSIEWSLDGAGWTPIATVASGTTLEMSVDIGAPSTDVHVRVVDPDGTRGEHLPDWVSVDFLQIRLAD